MVVMVNNEDDLRKGKMRMIFFFLGGEGMGLEFKGFFVCVGVAQQWLIEGVIGWGRSVRACRWFNFSNKEESKCVWLHLWRGGDGWERGGSNIVAKKNRLSFFYCDIFFMVFFYGFPHFVCVWTWWPGNSKTNRSLNLFLFTFGPYVIFFK